MSIKNALRGVNPLLDALCDAVSEMTITEESETKLFATFKTVLYMAGSWIADHFDGGPNHVSVIKIAAKKPAQIQA